MAIVLLDRDGVINKNRDDHVTRWEDFRFLPRSLEAMAAMRRLGFRLAVVTNQSAVGRGLLTSEALGEIHRRMQAECASRGAAIEAVFACLHTPWDGCDCRKPRPGLFHWAMAALDEPPEACVTIGDSLSDLRAAEAIGLPFVLVRTGHGEETLRRLTPHEHARLLVAGDLWEAYQAIQVYFHPRRRLEAA